MKRAEFIRECTLGGPGLDGYAYNAATFCEDCGEKIVREIAGKVAHKIADTSDPSFSDSEQVPQPIFFGESDTAQHCDDCGAYLYGEDVDAEDADSENNDTEDTDSEPVPPKEHPGQGTLIQN